jgi:hypothetical protein
VLGCVDVTVGLECGKHCAQQLPGQRLCSKPLDAGNCIPSGVGRAASAASAEVFDAGARALHTAIERGGRLMHGVADAG